MVNYKVTKAHDGLWYVFRKYPITSGKEYRWVIESQGFDTRAQAFGGLPSGENAEDTITLTN